MSDARLVVRLPRDLLVAVDRARGDVPRSVFVRRALERHLVDATRVEPPPKPRDAGRSARPAVGRNMHGVIS